MRKIDWIVLGLIILSFLYPWYVFQCWQNYATENKRRIVEDIQSIRRAFRIEQENWAKLENRIDNINRDLSQKVTDNFRTIDEHINPKKHEYSYDEYGP